ncbi:MAG: oligosaccharide flippase family protein [Bacteroidota bacterium]
MKSLSAGRVFKNGLISICFQGIPIILALIAIPKNIEHIGDTLWGLYSLTITILFLFMYFNFGINPSVNKKLSEALGKNEKKRISILLSNGFFFNLASSILLCFLIYFFAPSLVNLFVQEEDTIHIAETLFRYAAIAGGISLLISFYRNVYEAKQNFLLVSFLRTILSSTILVAPTIGYLMGLDIIKSFNLVLVVYFLVWFIYTIIFLKEYSIPKFKLVEKKVFFELLFFGIWITGHSLLNPIYLFLDRFFISSTIGLDEVAFYTTPYDLVSKMTLVSGSITAAFFPAISYWHSKGDTENLLKSFKKTFGFLFFSLLAVSIVLTLIAPFFLEFWINTKYMSKSTGVFRILVFGYFVSSLSLVFLRFIYGIGIPKYAFFVNLFMVPFYLLLLVALVNLFGIEGAAWSFLIKSVLDFIFLYIIIIKKTGIVVFK